MMESLEFQEAPAEYLGVIKNFDIHRGWGFIECDQTHDIYGKDIFLLRSQLTGIMPAKGAQVYFDVTEGQKGVEATNVHIVPASAENEGGETYIGSIKSWNPQKGWGHIQCEATHALYEKDIFVMRSAVPGGHVSPGDQVSFSVVEGQKGVEACSVELLSKPILVPTAIVPIAGNSNGFGNKLPRGLQGNIKTFNDEKGWGHITCEVTRQLYGKDMFFLKSALKGQSVDVGQEVRFDVCLGVKGFEAQNIMIEGGTRINGYVTPATGDLAQGTIKNWNPDKGWGFIACEETMSIYGKDIFLHKKELLGQSPAVGAPVQFSVGFGEDGRPIAVQVSLLDGYQAAHTQSLIKRTVPY